MNKLVTFFILATAASSVNCDVATDLQVTGRGIVDVARNLWQYIVGNDDYDYNDYADYSNSDDVSSYSFYNPNSARRESFDVTGEEEEYSWGEMALGAVGIIIPAVFLFSAFNPFPANLFTIAVKKRSFESNYADNFNIPEMNILRTIQESDFMNILKPSCQKKVFCEISQLGKQDDANVIQKAFYYVSHLTPTRLARRLQLLSVFEATKQNQCSLYSCTKSAVHEAPSNHIETPTETE